MDKKGETGGFARPECKDATLKRHSNGNLTGKLCGRTTSTPHADVLRFLVRCCRTGGTEIAVARRFVLAAVLFLITLTSISRAEIRLPEVDPSLPIRVSASTASRWTQGSYEVWVLEGGCEITQGVSKVKGQEAVLWVDRNSPMAEGKNKIIVYVERVEVSRTDGDATAKAKDEKWFERLHTTGPIEFDVPQVQGVPASKPAIYDRGMVARSPESANAIRRTQYTEYGVTPVGPPIGTTSSGTRRIQVIPRSNVDMNATMVQDPPESGQWVGQCTGGINLIVEGIDETLPGMPADMTVGAIDVSADRLVLWTTGLEPPDTKGQTLQSKDMPLEIYLEGNIVFRQGERRIYAERMYYNVQTQTGVVLDSELLSPLPGYAGLLRMRSKILQQTGPDTFFAQQSYFTSSRFGEPRYRFEMGDVTYEDFKTTTVDPISGQTCIERDPWVTGRNSVLYFGGVPVFYWPWLRAPATDPTFYIDRIAIKSDNIFGKQILTDWDMFDLLGMRDQPVGVEWDLSLDYMSYRGMGHGTTIAYQRNDFFSWPGETVGLADYWGIYDTGTDNLGRGQRDVPLAVNYRYRAFWQHRQRLPRNWTLTSEFGLLSDRNFLEEYFEREWDELKDETTGLRLEHRLDNRTFSIEASARLNPYFTQTEWLPRLDHFWLGEPLFNDTFTWFEHSSATYANYKIAEEPPNQVQEDLFVLLPWETSPAKGERLITTQELDWPIEMGVVKVVPYGLGQLGHWGEDLNGERIDRVYWQAGVRTSMPMWRVNPEAESSLWNVHGLAHKIVYDVEFSTAQANKDVRLFPLYDPIDDDSIENFRRRMEFLTFGSPGNPELPWRFDPRSYAIRDGLASWVTSPSAEIVDDMMAMRMNISQRWQTKRGAPGNRRIIDWMTLDTGAVWFPKAERDDFGKSIGLVSYDYAWHMGDRFTLISNGIFDFLEDGQNIVTIGGFLNRPPRGNLYLGFRLLEGPVDSKIVSLSYNYWMSPKWVSSFGTSFDLTQAGNIGQRFNITRVGESLLVGLGFNVDSSKNNVGVMFTVEPRFLPKTRLGQVGGVQIPVAGMQGLE